MRLKIYTAFFLMIPLMVFTQLDHKNHPFLTDKLVFGAGIYIPKKTVDFQVNGSIETHYNTNTNQDFSESIGLDDSQLTLNLMAFFRFSKHWKLAGQYFSVDNSKKAVLQEDIQWNDYTFKKGSSIHGGFNIDMYRIFVGRTISSGQIHELGAGIGVHLLDVSAFIKGTAYINDQAFKNHKESASVVAPLPNVGVWYYLAPFKNFIVMANIDWFALSINQYNGSLWNINGGINYQILNKLGVGLSYRFFDVGAGVNQSDWDGRFDMSFSGPLITLTTNF